MEGVVFAPHYWVVLDDIHDDRNIIGGCFGKNGHYPPRPEDDEWDEIVLKLALKWKKLQEKNNN